MKLETIGTRHEWYKKFSRSFKDDSSNIDPYLVGFDSHLTASTNDKLSIVLLGQMAAELDLGIMFRMSNILPWNATGNPSDPPDGPFQTLLQVFQR